ncbi:helicase-related protein [Streptomyces sp. TLI_171]|uniref:helicase-related protein n=1 Tax=Streptomyces sp. TLI_171 TaxID=1938859 RepID=UPI000C688985|nr:helicase-related protein [Streptomyces sp. TLI_171]RKE17557.1 SNF2 domain-containing protein [Streptomyces sp. TLI_171]
MVASDAGHAIDRLRKHLTGATRLDSLSESFSLFVFEALQDELTNVDLRLLLHDHSLEEFPLNGLEEENLKRARLDQHRIARAFAAWAEGRLRARTLTRRTRGTWTSVAGPFPYAVVGAGLEAESLGLVASRDLHFPQESTDADKVTQTVVDFDRMWHDDATTHAVQEEFLDAARALYEERAPESVYLRVLTSLFKDFVEESGDETAERGRTGFYDSAVWNKLYKFQRDGVLGAIEKLERHNGCIIADSVGLGKTFEALAVIKYYELRNDRVLVLAPKRLRENWTVYRSNDNRNPLAEDRFHYDVLNHTDLSRSSGLSGGIDLANINWGNYDLVVIDESHNFRNNPQVTGRITRYERLMSEVFKRGVKTKVLMLSATPVNTRLADLKNQVLFATEGDDQALATDGIKSIEATLTKAQRLFNNWQRMPPATRSTKSLVGTLGMDYIRLLDLVTIARSRKHIQKYYGTKDVGKFPDRLAPINLTPPIDAAGTMIPLEKINRSILRLNLAAYKPTSYVSAKHEDRYATLYDQKVRTGGQRVWRQTDRENNVVHLLRVGLLKRLESSVNSLGKTLEKILATIDRAIASIDAYQASGGAGTSIDSFSDLENLDLDDPQFEDTVGGSVKVFLADIDRIRWRQELQQDRDTVSVLLAEVKAVDAGRDAKLVQLKHFLRSKVEHPTNDGNRKALVFTAFSDTAEYLYEHVARWANDKLGVHVALITGQTTRTTLPMSRTQMIDVLTAFSPRSKGGDLASPQIDLVIATDTISEGQNLQDCDTVINYDIHWNPVRIVQRFGRVDRLGTINTSVQLVNFWPNMDLDAYINLETRVSSRMTLLDVSATGEENVLDVASGGMNDLDYRRRQLQQMQKAAPTMEDLAGSLSITDLTLSDFRMDAAARPRKAIHEITGWPLALFGVTRFDSSLASEGVGPGAIFLLRVRDNAFAFSKAYPLAPYVLAYVTDDGTMAHPVEEPKLALDVLRHHCLGGTEPDSAALADFDMATRSGASMKHYRGLLDAAVRTASGKAEESMVASLFSAGPSQLGTDAGVPGLESVDVVAWVAIIP